MAVAKEAGYEIYPISFNYHQRHSIELDGAKKIAAFYYNLANEWGEEVVICYKHDAFMFGTALVDVERGQFSDVKPFYWQTDTAIAKNSWCYTENNEFKKAKDILCDLVDIVSKNGNLLLNVGPRADGTITEEDQAVLLEIGEWLKTNGEAIYGSRTWRFSWEGPTKIQEGQFTDSKDKVFTSEDFRFTVKGDSVYVFALNYPDTGKITIQTLGVSDALKLPTFCGIIDSIDVLGFDEVPQWQRDEKGLHITTKDVHSDKPVVFRVKMV